MEALSNYYPTKNITYNDRAHNILLQVSSSIGIPGLIIHIGIIIFIALKCLKIIKKDNVYMMIYFTAFCYFISSMFGNSMFYTSPYFALLMGLLIGLYRNNIVVIKTKTDK